MTSAFKNLYPDVDPSKGLPLKPAERASLALAFAISAFGAVKGDYIIAGAGLALVILASLLQSQQTARRIRTEARNRFPGEDWAEYHTSRRLNLGLMVPLFCAVIIALCAAGFWFIPLEYSTLGAALIAIAVFALVWFMPGLNPVWSKKKQGSTTSEAEPASSRPARYYQGTAKSAKSAKSLSDETTEFKLDEKL